MPSRSGNLGDLNFLRSLFEEIVLFIFELILWELYKDWFGTHGFILLVLLEGARVTFSVPSCLCQISCQLPICLSLLLSWCLWFHEYPCLFRFSLVEIFSLPRFFSCQAFSVANIFLLPKLFSWQYFPFSCVKICLSSRFSFFPLSRSLRAGLPVLPRLMHCPYKVPAKKIVHFDNECFRSCGNFWWYSYNRVSCFPNPVTIELEVTTL